MWLDVAAGLRNERTSPIRRDHVKITTSVPDTDDLRFAHLQFVLATPVGEVIPPEHILPFCTRVIDGPNTFPLEVWSLFLQTSLTPLRQVMRSTYVCCMVFMQRLYFASGSLTLENFIPRRVGVGLRFSKRWSTLVY